MTAIMQNEIIIPEEVISDKIYVIRDQKVMLDKDLAELYKVETRTLKQAVKRNLDLFPSDFMFVLTEKEINLMVSQSVIPSKQIFGGSHPYVFTETGIAMLSSVLKSLHAKKMNIAIMRAFVALRKMTITQKDILIELEEIKKKMVSQDEKIEVVFDYLTKFITQEQEPREQIGFKTKPK
ncbi:MAG: hypothetical protein ACI857_003255 [Arenicella sp.]|jgi:hypothetical protein